MFSFIHTFVCFLNSELSSIILIAMGKRLYHWIDIHLKPVLPIWLWGTWPLLALTKLRSASLVCILDSSSKLYILDRDLGKPVNFVLCTNATVWYTASYWTLSQQHSWSSYLTWVLLSLFVTNLATLFWRTCNDFRRYFSQPPHTSIR